MKRLLLLIALTSGAYAQTGVIGDWRGSNGSVFHVPASQGAFKLKLTDSKGKAQEFPANWETPGKSFTWQDAQGSRHEAVFQSDHKPPRFRDVGSAFPDSPGYWYSNK